MSDKNRIKILFVNPYPYYASGTNDATIYPPLGMLYIASVLEKSGFLAMVIDANAMRMENKDVMEKISEYSPDIVGVYANIISARSAIELGKIIRNGNKNIRTVIGGPLATTLPDKFISVFDMVVRGEGEMTFLDICRGVGIESIDGISYMKNNNFIHNRDRKLIENLDVLPFPAIHLLEPDIKSYNNCRARRTPVATILTSRGCPYHCFFCNKNIFGHVFRKRSPENVVSEIKYMTEKFGIRQIDILDDNFTMDMDRAEKICDLIIENRLDIAINCQSGIRVDRITERLAEKLKMAGVFKVGIGIESGDEKMLKIMKKQIDFDKIKNAIKIFRKNGIITYGFFILGLPGDTPESMQRTIDFSKEANPDIANFCIAMPFPGTEMHEVVKTSGVFLQDVENGIFSGFYNGDVFFETNETKKEDVIKFYKKAYKSFYFRPMKLMDMIINTKSRGELKHIIRATTSIIRGII